MKLEPNDFALELITALKSSDGRLLKAKIFEDIHAMDVHLISLLLENERIKDEFFTPVKDALVFDKQKFAWLVESKEFLPNSYTKYTNKIGLANRELATSGDVVLVGLLFPQ